jgi:hypothetical protein
MFGREISNEGAVSTASLISAAPPTTPPVKRFVSGGSDNTVKIWRYCVSFTSIQLIVQQILRH